MIVVNCPQCQHSIRAPEAAAGKKVRCPECSSIVRIPAAEAVADIPLAPEEPAPAPEVVDKPRGKKRKKKAETAKSSWQLYAGIAGGGVLLVGLIVWAVVAVAGRKGKDQLPDGPLVREAQPHPSLIALADVPVGSDWQLEPDPGEAPAPGARSAFVIPDTLHAEGVYFGSPASGKVAIVQLSRRTPMQDVPPRVNIPAKREWLQYDVRTAAPVGRVELLADAGNHPKDVRPWFNGDQGSPPHYTAPETSLSPSGDHLAHRDAPTKPFEIWAADGKKAQTIQMRDGAKVQWLRLVDDGRILVGTPTHLVLRNLANDGPVAYSVPFAGVSFLALSPTRKYAAVAGADGIAWHRVQDGTVAGKVALKATRVQAGCFAPDGGRFAAIVLEGTQSAFYVWDLKTGKPIVGRRLTQMPGRGPDFYHSMFWLTPRLVGVNGGEVYDAATGWVYGGVSSSGNACIARAPVDGRCWAIPFIPLGDGNSLRLAATLFEKPADLAILNRERTFLGANSTLFKDIDDRLQHNLKGNGWHPNIAVRIEIDSYDDDKRFLKEVGHALADHLAKWGMRVDPQAEAVARLTIQEPKLLVLGQCNLQMRLKFTGPAGEWGEAAFTSEPAIASDIAAKRDLLRRSIVGAIPTYASPSARLLPDSAGPSGAMMSKLFAPDGQPAK